ncbi:MAG: YtpR family tRNA-binding protein [Sphingopyxis sp.]
MKITLGWLKEHLDTTAGVDEVVARLNRIGLEVEGVEDPAARLVGFRVARVLSAAPHPGADKLQVLSVDAGGGPVQVVCGAPNARAGLIGVFGQAGAVVPSNGMELRVAAIRGVTSNGMMCSSRELELGDDHGGIIELPDDAPVGQAFADYAGASDPVIDISITPNRQDCMGVRGIARDLAAAGLGRLKPLLPRHGADAAYAPLAEALTALADEAAMPPCAIAIRTDDPEGCPAFWGRTIHGVTNGASPAWIQRRLNAVGQRSISALVDITNFVMLDLGRPSHAYDLAQLHGAVNARKALDGEAVIALDGKHYTLSDRMTVIADAHGVHDIAGIKGGEHSGCSDATSDVLLEVAYFTPENIAMTGQALSLTSDARSRFERGVDPAFLDDAITIITALIIAHCGGTASTITRAGAPPLGIKMVAYDPTLCASLGGIDVAEGRQRTILESLGFTIASVRAEEGQSAREAPSRSTLRETASTGSAVPQGERPPGIIWAVTVPSWRRDIDGPADLVEEVTRIIGFDHIVSVPLPRAPGVAKPTATADQMTERKLRRAAAMLGLHEAITWSFIPEKEADSVGGGTWRESSWILANPISEEMKVMRPSLLPGLLSAAARNQARGAPSVRLFEIGRRYLADAERATLALIMAGAKSDRSWAAGKAKAFDAFDAKAAAIALLDAAGAPIDRLMVMGIEDAGGIWHPGQSGTLRLGPKTILAEFGALHPALTRAFDVDGGGVAAQIFLDALPAKRGGGVARDAFSPPPLQSVTRDFAFLVPDTMAAGDLVRVVKGADKAAIVDARLFDRFDGAGVPDGQLSLAVEVTLQPSDKSFTEAEIKAISDKVIAAAAKLGATLRT